MRRTARASGGDPQSRRRISAAGIGDPTRNLAVLGAFTDSTLANYDLSTSIGPIMGTTAFNPYPVSFMTTLGGFSMTSVSDVTFQAVVVPEPSIAALIGLGLIVNR